MMRSDRGAERRSLAPGLRPAKVPSRASARRRWGALLLLLGFWPGLAASHAAPEADDLVLLEITDLGGCRGCAGSLERALERLEGIVDAALDDERPQLRVRLAPEAVFDAAALRTAVRDKGYTVGRIEVLWSGRLTGPPWRFRRQRVEVDRPLQVGDGLAVSAGEHRVRALVTGEGEQTVLKLLELESLP